MDQNLAIVFVSMSLTLAMTRMMSFTWDHYTISICLYYILRRINYYIIDKKFASIFDHVIKPGRELERIIETYLGVITLFFFLVAGYYVVAPREFFLWNALALLINILWLYMVRELIDPLKDTNRCLKISKIYKNSMIENFVELFLCLAVGLTLLIQPDFKNLGYDLIKPWAVYICLGILFFIMIFDLVIHKEFFSSRYRTDCIAED